MRRLLLASAAVASLVIGLPAVQAQQAEENLRNRSPGASQQTSPRAGDRDGDRASPRQGRSNEAAQPQRAPAGEKPARAADDSRQRGTSGARAQDEDKPARDRAERSKSSGQAGERSGEQRRDARDRSQRDEARDERRDRSDQERSRTSRDRAGDRDRDRARTGQDRDRADRDRADRERTTTTGQSRDDRATTESRRSSDSVRPDGDRRDRADRREDTQRGSVSLSQEQRTRISARFSDRIDRLNVRPIERSRLSVSVGVTVPRAIRVHDVPVDIVEIYPRFRGHKFVVVEDEIVIIEPSSRRIVATIPREGGRAASRSTTGAAAGGSRLRLREEDRSVIRTVVMRDADCRHETRLDFTIGLPLPRTVEICEFPDEVLTAVPEVRRYRYVVRGDDIVLVDPDEHRIVEVID